MVTSLGAQRNNIYSNLLELDKKLNELGLVCINDEIVYLEEGNNV